MRERFLELIQRETQHARAGRGGRIVAKMNALVDKDVIDALYAASEAGVEIDLIVRGICCLRPGLPGVSSRIRVISIVGRFLEHSRVWQFGNGGDDEFYIGSADWMPRNFLSRVEAAAPVEVPKLRERLRTLLGACLEDNRNTWELDADGRYNQRVANGDERPIHERLLVNSWGEDTPLRERTAEHPVPREPQPGD
jgi:polyphosphate kinase